MADFALPALFALFLWWFSTGAILYLDGLARTSFRWSMLGATALAMLAHYGLWASSADASVSGAYVAFMCGLAIWGWHEMSFLMGFVTGPRRDPSPADAGSWRRFGHATQTVLYHELAILASVLLVLALTWEGDNQVGTWTFIVLWLMRVSAKLNLHFGVPNLNTQLLPEHLGYLRPFLTCKPMSVLFPVTVTLATVVAAEIVGEALSSVPGSFERVGCVLLAALMALAILEHWLLVLPLPDTALWRWALGSRAEPVSSESRSLAMTPAGPATIRPRWSRA